MSVTVMVSITVTASSDFDQLVCLSVTVMVCITVMAGFFNERYCNGEHYSNGTLVILI
jgi:hypothetical protein